MTRARDGGLPTIRVRRLSNSGLLGRRRRYEVASFPDGSTTPSWVRRTSRPASVLRAAGAHPTDIHDHVAAADAAWTGGVGPWRSAFPSPENE